MKKRVGKREITGKENKNKIIYLIIALLIVIAVIAIVLVVNNMRLTGNVISITGGAISGPTDYLAYWDFNGNPNDDTGNYNLLVGGVSPPTLTTDKDGNANSAYAFDGDDYFYIEDNLLLQNSPATGSPPGFSGAVWINIIDNAVASTYIWEREYVNFDLYFDTSGSSGIRCRIQYIDVDGLAKSALTGRFTLSFNTWRHVACVYDNTNNQLKLYVDGNEESSVSTFTTTSFKNPDTADFAIGARPNLGTGGFKGSIDEVVLYDRALSASEVQTIYTGEPPSGCSTDSECSDDLYCTGVETCNLATGTCQSGTAISCNDGDSCTTDSCVESTDSCANTLISGCGGSGSLDAVIEVNAGAYNPLGVSLTDYYAPLPVFFEGWKSSPRDEIVDYVWDFGDDAIQNGGFNAAHVYETPGTYIARLTVKNSAGQINSETININVRQRDINPSDSSDGTTYYVDSALGDNGNNGLTTGTAWETADKAFAGMKNGLYGPGDQILFKRGQTFLLSSNIQILATDTTSYGYIFSTYSSGEKPIIKPSSTYPGGNAIEFVKNSGVPHIGFIDLHFDGVPVSGGQPFGNVFTQAQDGGGQNYLWLRTEMSNSGRFIEVAGMPDQGKELSGFFIIDSTFFNSNVGSSIFTKAWRVALIGNTVDFSENHLNYLSFISSGIILDNTFSRAAFGRDALRIDDAPYTGGGCVSCGGPTHPPSSNVYIANNNFLGWIDPLSVGTTHGGQGVRYNWFLVEIAPNAEVPQSMENIVFENNILTNAENLLTITDGENIIVRNNLLVSPTDKSGTAINFNPRFAKRPLKNIDIIGNTFVTGVDEGTDGGLIKVNSYTDVPYNGQTQHEDITIKNNIIYSVGGKSSYAIAITEDDPLLYQEVRTDKNIYYLPGQNSVFKIASNSYNLADWNSKTGNVDTSPSVVPEFAQSVSLFSHTPGNPNSASVGISEANSYYSMFKLSSSSPAKDAGANLLPDLYYDFDRNVRIQYSPFDIGAFEYTGDGPAPACTLTSASWNTTSATDGDVVTMNVVGNSECPGQEIEFEIYENDLIIDDFVTTILGSYSSKTWTSHWTYEGDDDIGNDTRDYYFKAKPVLNPDNIITSSNNILVSKVEEIPVICVLTSASWNSVIAKEGESVTLTVNGQNCDGQIISIEVWEEDNSIGDIFDDKVLQTPLIVNFAGNSASKSWNAVWQDDSFLTETNPPEYYFIATVSESSVESLHDSSNYDLMLKVIKCGDGITNGNEACDDGDLNGEPNKCNLQCSGTTGSVCGNNVVESNERCDDGNVVNGDGCSATCQKEGTGRGSDTRGGSGGGGGGGSSEGGSAGIIETPILASYENKTLFIEGIIKRNTQTTRICENCQVVVSYKDIELSAITDDKGYFSVTFEDVEVESGANVIYINVAGKKSYTKEIYIENE